MKRKSVGRRGARRRGTLAEFDAETRFLARAARGRGKTSRGLALIAKASRRPASA